MDSGLLGKNIRMKNTEYRMEGKPAKSFEDLIMWKKAHQFVLAVYEYTENFPKQEVYGLVSQ